MSEDSDPERGEKPRSVWEQLHAWAVIGTQSVGGGASTLYLIRSLLVRRKGWLTMREYMEDWTLSRLSVGVHLIALTALIGRRFSGWRGVGAAVLGLLVPSGLITAALTAAFTLVRDRPEIGAALAGAGPVTVGMMAGITIVLVRPMIRSGRWAVVDVAVLLVAAAVGLLVAGATFAVIVSGAVLGALSLGEAAPDANPADN